MVALSCERLVLAPMEGVLDPLMRELLTAINPYDLCVTEFVRVVDALLPARTYYKLAPELKQGGKTRSGTQVRVQLLGQSPEWMAENAVLAAQLGSPGIDVNFGCPARHVNQSKGGASLLKEPELIYRILRAMRQALPAEVPLSAKIRLGWACASECEEIADAVVQGGANELAIHGRTKQDGYRSEAINWTRIGEIRARLPIPVTANGEIWNREDALRCQAITGCRSLMVGRGALNVPNLGAVIRHQAAPLPWSQVLALMHDYAGQEIKGDKGRYFPNRIKQWLSYLREAYPQAQSLFAEIRRLQTAAQILQALCEQRRQLAD